MILASSEDAAGVGIEADIVDHNTINGDDSHKEIGVDEDKLDLVKVSTLV